ncbi:MAG: hypothetical protein HOI95_13440 [Chromatiales bacterium]|jgi:hypothetical protein|nr:hypothetical protein [Chromatiales bacterium]
MVESRRAIGEGVGADKPFGDKPVRTKVIPAGTVDRGCTLPTELMVEKGHLIVFQAEQGGKTGEVDEHFSVVRFGACG